MTYYEPRYYTERYFIPFSDVDGHEWKVSIQQPEYEGTATALQGAEIPVEWMGRGDEAQDDVVLGSTGTIRIICREQDVQSNLLEQGNLLPKFINDCRVQVMRYNSGYWDVYWQGFIVPQTFTQDWDSAPFMIELPIASVVAAMEYFPMPLPVDNCYSAFEEVTSVAGLLREIFRWSGCDIFYIKTNKVIYEDFNGQTQMVNSHAAQWSQGLVSSSFFYNAENGIIQPKTFKDVLETIAYPFGKIQEFSTSVAFLMRWKNDAQSEAKMYKMPIWDDYVNSVLADSVTFDDYEDIRKINLSEINTEGTDNKTDKIMAPSAVNFSSELTDEETIFEMSDKCLKTSLNIENDMNNGIIQKKVYIQNGAYRYVYPIDIAKVNMGFAKNFTAAYKPQYTGIYQYLNTSNLCKVVDVTISDVQTFNISTVINLGIYFTLSQDGNTSRFGICSFEILMPVKTVIGVNMLNLKIKPFHILLKEPSPNLLYIAIKDLHYNRYLIYDEISRTWLWQSRDELINAFTSVEKLTLEDGEYVLPFYDDRGLGDDSTHHLQLFILCQNLYSLPEPIAFCEVKLEYIDYNFLTWNSDHTQAIFPESAVVAELAKSTNNRLLTQCDSSNEELSIAFKTLAGNKYARKANCIIPYNSFCDNPQYIDKKNREKIEINAAKFETYYSGGYFELVSSYCVIKDGDKVYIPVAVGLNPRMNSVKLRLITTNV